MDVANYFHSLIPGQWDAHQVCGVFLAFGGMGMLYRPVLTYAMVLGAGIGGLFFSDLSNPLHSVYMLAAMLVGSISLAPTIRQRASWQFTVASLTLSVGASLFFHNHGMPDLQHYVVGTLVVLGGGVMMWTTRRPSLQPFGGLIMIVTGLLLFNYTSPSRIHRHQDLASSDVPAIARLKGDTEAEYAARSLGTLTQDTSPMNPYPIGLTPSLREKIH